ncbi:MAG: DUF488 domain-containing protein [Planctomycetota bacterium]
MLRAAGGRASRLQLVKWSFLVLNESSGGGGSAFYCFLPYLRGPFSFSLYHEIAKLVHGGFVSEPDDETWELTAAGEEASGTAPDNIGRDVLAVMEERASQPVGDMVEYVYATYPWYTLKSQSGARVEPPVAETAVQTAGYEGKSVDAFLDGILRAGVRRIVDVRRNPVARRYGFHGSTLARLCGKLGLDYRHFPELGVPSDERRGLSTKADYEVLLGRYEVTTLQREADAVREVGRLAAEEPSVLVCSEADPSRCHRSRLAEAASRLTGLPVRHLGAAA